MKDEEIIILIAFLSFIFGAVLGATAFSNPDIDVDCVADQVEDRIEQGLAIGYVVHPLLSNTTTIQDGWNWYKRYTFISRSLLEREINISLDRCKK